MLKTNKIAVHLSSTEAEEKIVERDSISKQLLLDVIREARAINKTKVQKCTLTTRNRSEILEMKEVLNNRKLFELTDEELLSAFALVKN